MEGQLVQAAEQVAQLETQVAQEQAQVLALQTALDEARSASAAHACNAPAAAATTAVVTTEVTETVLSTEHRATLRGRFFTDDLTAILNNLSSQERFANSQREVLRSECDQANQKIRDLKAHIAELDRLNGEKIEEAFDAAFDDARRDDEEEAKKATTDEVLVRLQPLLDSAQSLLDDLEETAGRGFQDMQGMNTADDQAIVRAHEEVLMLTELIEKIETFGVAAPEYCR